MQPNETHITEPAARQRGALRYVGQLKLGRTHYDYWQCDDCGTQYPQTNLGVSCNGKPIGLCPWCRTDSKPWTNGRGR